MHFCENALCRDWVKTPIWAAYFHFPADLALIRGKRRQMKKKKANRDQQGEGSFWQKSISTESLCATAPEENEWTTPIQEAFCIPLFFVFVYFEWSIL